MMVSPHYSIGVIVAPGWIRYFGGVSVLAFVDITVGIRDAFRSFMHIHVVCLSEEGGRKEGRKEEDVEGGLVWEEYFLVFFW